MTDATRLYKEALAQRRDEWEDALVRQVADDISRDIARRPWLTKVEQTATLHTYGEPSREVDAGYMVETGTNPGRMTTDEFMAWLESASVDELERFGAGRRIGRTLGPGSVIDL